VAPGSAHADEFLGVLRVAGQPVGMPLQLPADRDGTAGRRASTRTVTLRLLAVNLAERRPVRVGELLRDPPA